MTASHVQTGEGDGSTTMPAATMGVAPTLGNLLVAAVGTKNAATFVESAGWTRGPNGDQLGTFYKLAGPAESTTQAPCTIGSMGWACAVDEYDPGGGAVTLDVSGATNDASSPQDRPALNPTDSIDTVLWGAASNENGTTYAGQTIGGVAATERGDLQHSTGATVTTFDRLNVNTSTDTFAAQATPGGSPTNGAIALLIFKVTAVVAAAASFAAVSTIDVAGSVYKTGAAAFASASSVTAAGVVQYAGAAAFAAVSSFTAISRTLDEAGSVAFSEAVRGAVLLSAALRGALELSEAVRGSVAVSVVPLEVA